MVLLSLLITESLAFTSIFKRFELWSFDARAQSVRADKLISDKVAVVLIDESSLKALEPAYGHFPWPRSAYADLLDFLSVGKPRAVVFDLLFSERHLDATRTRISQDDLSFINATEHHPYVVLAAQLFPDETLKFMKDSQVPELPKRFVGRYGIKSNLSSRADNNSYVIPIPGLWQAAAGIGIVNIPPDMDGVYRQVPLYQRYGDRVYPSLSIAPLIRLGRNTSLSDNARQWLNPDNHTNYLVNMYGKRHPYSISGLLSSWSNLQNGEVEKMLVNPMEFKDKYVFIGASAVGLDDIKSTAVSQITPGVMIHASVLSNLLSNDILKRVPSIYTLVLGILLALFASIFILYGQRWVLGYLLPVASLAVYVYAAFELFAHNYVVSIVEPVLLVLFSILLGSGYKAVTEGRDRRRVKHMFSQYVSSAVLDELLLKYQDHISAGDGTRQQVTILFSDIRGFTSFSENLPPEKVVELLNIYLGEMSSIIMRDGGTIDKFIGDAIMAFWGAPVISDDHADKAVTACLEMIEALYEVNRRLEEKGFEPLKVGIGLHTGYAILGNIGSENKLDYTVIGDTVNLASRVEGLTKQYGCPILLTEDTCDALSYQVPLAIIDAVKVKGKNIPIKLYAPPTGRDGRILDKAEAEMEISLIEQGFNYYLNKNWPAALSCYTKVQNPILADKYINRCQHYMEAPPESDWDGVFVHTSK
jgi:adenylate cyclase